jgi:hypothetical protein
MGRRVRVDAGRDESGEMGHVAEKERADLVCDRSEAIGLDRPRVGGAPADDQLGPAFLRRREHLVEIDERRLAVDSVADEVVQLPREVDLEAVREVAAMVEPHGQHCVPGLEAAEVHGHVRLRACVWLHVRVLGAEELLRPVDGQLLDLVHDLAAAVVTAPGVALRVLVRRHTPHCLEDARPGEVLGGDQLDLTALALELALDEGSGVGIDLGQPGPLELLQRLLRDRHLSTIPRHPAA